MKLENLTLNNIEKIIESLFNTIENDIKYIKDFTPEEEDFRNDELTKLSETINLVSEVVLFSLPQIRQLLAKKEGEQ
jgi:hypothetical protein